MLHLFAMKAENRTTESLLGQAMVPPGLCLPWTPNLSWPQAASHIATGVTCIAIPVGVAALILRRSKLMFRWTSWLFVLSVLTFATTHLADVGVLWHPDNAVQALSRADLDPDRGAVMDHPAEAECHS